MQFYNNTSEEVLKELGTSAEGLNNAETTSRLEKNGKNKLAEAKKVSNFRRFLNQLADPMLIILMIAAAVSLGIAIIEK